MVQLLLLSFSVALIAAPFVQAQSSDYNLTVIERAEKYGYSATEHIVTTSDGYKLGLYNILNTTCNGYAKTPVLAMHGLLQSSEGLFDTGLEDSLGYLFADDCKNLWVGNVRGNYLSRAHETLNPDTDAAFWEYSPDNIGAVDIPAFVDYILEHIGASSLYYIGMPQASAVGLIMLSSLPEYNAKIKQFVALAPAVRLINTPSEGFRTLVSGLAADTSATGEVRPRGSVICPDVSNTENCRAILAGLDSAHEGSYTDETIQILFAHFPAGGSRNSFKQFNQWMNNAEFNKLDLGTEQNLVVYGTETPPVYNLSQVTAPVRVLYGMSDRVVAPEDAQWVADNLPNGEGIAMPDEVFNHFDFCYSQYISEQLYPLISKVFV